MATSKSKMKKPEKAAGGPPKRITTATKHKLQRVTGAQENAAKASEENKNGTQRSK
mgnify:CR=1 FL=1